MRKQSLYIQLLWRLTETELRARYKNTVFGFVWLVANPLLQMMIIGFVFPLFIREPVENYNAFLFTGLLVWNFFSLSLSKTTPAIVNERSLVKKASFARSVLPMSIIFSNLIHFLSALLLFCIPMAFEKNLTMWSLPYALLAIVLLTFFTSGISLLTCALNVKYRDVTFFVSALLIVWFYATPIVYSLNQMPHSLLWLWQLNPLTSLVQILQHAMAGADLPTPVMFVTNLISSLVIFILGTVLFSIESKNFDDWI